MHKIRKSLNEQYRPYTSIQNRHAIFQEFIPFSKERDTMGRLLRPALSAHISNSEKVFHVGRQQKEVPFIESKIEEKMNKYFKQSGLCNLAVELRKNKTIKKKSLINIILTQQPTVNRHNRDDNVLIKHKQSSITRQLQSGVSEWSPRKPATGDKQTIKIKRSFIPRCQSSITVTNPLRKREETSILTKGFKPKKEEPSLQHCQQLNMYHKRQQLQIKMQTTFEEGHLRFIDKMKQSKRLAQDIKIGIEQIDNYCLS